MVTKMLRSICIVFALAAQVFSLDQCYTLGISAPVPAPTTYQKCPGSSMCCRTNDKNADTCATEPNLIGLCRSKNFDIWRESCTDQRWREGGGCLPLCLDSYVGPNNVTINRAATDYLVTQCEDGSLCCGTRGSDEYGECCREKRGVWLDNLKVVSTKPVLDSMSSTSAPQTTAPPFTSQSGSSSAPPSPHSSNNTGAIVGGVIGGVAGILAIVLGMWLLRRHKRRNTTAMIELEATGPRSDGKYTMHTGLPYQNQHVPGELASRADPVELGDK